jgi:hypothetical protein
MLESDFEPEAVLDVAAPEGFDELAVPLLVVLAAPAAAALKPS